MEADMLETEGGDHLEVGVILPDGKKLMPIPKRLLRTSNEFVWLHSILHKFSYDVYLEDMIN